MLYDVVFAPSTFVTLKQSVSNCHVNLNNTKSVNSNEKHRNVIFFWKRCNDLSVLDFARSIKWNLFAWHYVQKGVDRRLSAHKLDLYEKPLTKMSLLNLDVLVTLLTAHPLWWVDHRTSFHVMCVYWRCIFLQCIKWPDRHLLL